MTNAVNYPTFFSLFSLLQDPPLKTLFSIILVWQFLPILLKDNEVFMKTSHANFLMYYL